MPRFEIRQRIVSLLKDPFCWCGCTGCGEHRSKLLSSEDKMAQNRPICLGAAEIVRGMTSEGIVDPNQDPGGGGRSLDVSAMNAWEVL